MGNGRVLLSLNFVDGQPFDASALGQRVRKVGALEPLDQGTAAMPVDARLKVTPAAEVKALEEFTLDVEVTADTLSRTQTIIDSTSPPIRLTINRQGTLVGAVHTEDGWQELRADTTITKGDPTPVRLSRDAEGTVRMEVGGAEAAIMHSAGALKSAGRAAMTIGSDGDGGRGFAGSVAHITLREGVITGALERSERKLAKRFTSKFSEVHGIAPLVVLDRGAVDERFNEIKAIMHAAGVSDLSEIGTLRVQQPTTLNPGTIMCAPRATGLGPVGGVDWSMIAGDIRAAGNASSGTDIKRMLDEKLLTRRTSMDTAAELTRDSAAIAEGTVEAGGVAMSATRLFRSRAVEGIEAAALREPLRFEAIEAVEGLQVLGRTDPWLWPASTVPPYVLLSGTIIPVDTAVIIARTLDLTNQTLLINPAVRTLYIIAEEVIAATGARITWQRPPNSVADRGDDPGLDGHSWTNPPGDDDSKHGRDGGRGGAGSVGINGVVGHDAPGLEIWAKRVTGLPDIDLDGQDGGRGGRGQRGGRGGRGQQGKNGTWWYVPFEKACWSHAGNGGHGGGGGDGGPGGSGANGGTGASITLAVLRDTLEAMVGSNPYTLQMTGGRAGDPGPGGPGGEGGPGGRRGFSEDNICTDCRDGQEGQRGRDGDLGQPGTAGGVGQMRVLVITEEAWDEQLTKPWVTQVVPNNAFPGTATIVRGSRFADTDRVILGTQALPTTLRADGGLEVMIPDGVEGGQHTLFVRRHDNAESNRVNLTVRPRLLIAPETAGPGTTVTLTGQAFVAGASVEWDGGLHPAHDVTRTSMSFTTPGVSGTGAPEALVGVVVVNPDGQRSNELTARVNRTLRNGFRVGTHDFKFDNFKSGAPSWGTYNDTFGALEISHEISDPIFGHPILTAAYYAFYHHFLLGTANGGLATGFCTSLASLAWNRFWDGGDNAADPASETEAFRRSATAVHGRLLSRETLLTMHDQGRAGTANVETTFRRIETSMATGGTRETSPLLFFIPSGPAWDAGYFDKLADSHCIVPVAITYPSNTADELDGAVIHCWDNNHPGDTSSRVVLRRTAGEIRFDFFETGTSRRFCSEDGITLGFMNLGQFLLSDHSLPFSGPFGLTSFVVDFLLSPATLRVTDGSGRVTGQVGGQILSEIPDSHPGYLLPNLYLLPASTGLTRRMTGTAAGSYAYHSISADQTSISLEGVATAPGETDELAINADGTRVRFTPAAPKNVGITLGRRVADQVRGLRVTDFAASAAADLDVTISPDLSLTRIANNGPDVALGVRVLGADAIDGSRQAHNAGAVTVPGGAELVVAVEDWAQLGPDSVSAMPM